MCMTCFELFFDVYLLSSILVSKYTSVDCPVHPQRLTEEFMAFVVAPFFVIKLIAINCCMSPQSVILQLALLWVLQPVC